MAGQNRRGKAPSYLIIFTIAIVLIVALVAVSQLINQNAPVEALSLGIIDRTVLSDQDVPRAELRDAKMAFDAGSAVFIDVRSVQSYEISHIPGALSIEIPEIKEETAEFDLEGLYITYCTWPDEASSARAAFNMYQLGFRNVYALLGGMQGWQAAGYPLESGAD